MKGEVDHLIKLKQLRRTIEEGLTKDLAEDHGLVSFVDDSGLRQTAALAFSDTPRLMRSLLAVDTSLRCAYVGWGRNYRARARIYFFVALGMGLRSDEFARSI